MAFILVCDYSGYNKQHKLVFEKRYLTDAVKNCGIYSLKRAKAKTFRSEKSAQNFLDQNSLTSWTIEPE